MDHRFTVIDVPDLFAELTGLLRQVPRGSVTTPGQLALALGDRAAAVWIGYYLLHHEHGQKCTCHRVVRAGGELGPYINGSRREKAELLAKEGIDVQQERVSLDRYAIEALVSSAPLLRLRRVQEELANQVRTKSWLDVPRWVAGVDCSYINSNKGVAAYVLYDVIKERMVWETTVSGAVRFPYVTSFLTFRELPLLAEVLDKAQKARRTADVILVDGSGVLHPRGAGIAAHLGVYLGVPTIGVTKNLLAGRPEKKPTQLAPCVSVIHDGHPAGTAVLPTSKAIKPIYVSPGHLTDCKLVDRLLPRLLAGHRLPEPLYLADRASREMAKSMPE